MKILKNLIKLQKKTELARACGPLNSNGVNACRAMQCHHLQSTASVWKCCHPNAKTMTERGIPHLARLRTSLWAGVVSLCTRSVGHRPTCTSLSPSNPKHPLEADWAQENAGNRIAPVFQDLLLLCKCFDFIAVLYFITTCITLKLASFLSPCREELLPHRR